MYVRICIDLADPTHPPPPHVCTRLHSCHGEITNSIHTTVVTIEEHDRTIITVVHSQVAERARASVRVKCETGTLVMVWRSRPRAARSVHTSIFTSPASEPVDVYAHAHAWMHAYMHKFVRVRMHLLSTCIGVIRHTHHCTHPTSHKGVIVVRSLIRANTAVQPKGGKAWWQRWWWSRRWWRWWWPI